MNLAILLWKLSSETISLMTLEKEYLTNQYKKRISRRIIIINGNPNSREVSKNNLALMKIFKKIMVMFQ